LFRTCQQLTDVHGHLISHEELLHFQTKVSQREKWHSDSFLSLFRNFQNFLFLLISF
jgi:hypothetical protein